jgi:hypothetical protein
MAANPIIVHGSTSDVWSAVAAIAAGVAALLAFVSLFYARRTVKSGEDLPAATRTAHQEEMAERRNALEQETAERRRALGQEVTLRRYGSSPSSWSLAAIRRETGAAPFARSQARRRAGWASRTRLPADPRPRRARNCGRGHGLGTRSNPGTGRCRNSSLARTPRHRPDRAVRGLIPGRREFTDSRRARRGRVSGRFASGRGVEASGPAGPRHGRRLARLGARALVVTGQSLVAGPVSVD